MKLILFIMLNYFYLIQISNCKKFRFYMHDEIIEYELDKKVNSYKEVFSLQNLELEQIDDENIIVGGYVDVLKSFDLNFPFQVILKTQALEQSVWKDQAIALSWADGCKEFLNKGGFWYNFTKLWDSEVCPPKKGVKMHIERQNCTILLDLPNNVPAGSWRAFILIVQATPMGKTSYGFGVESDLVVV